MKKISGKGKWILLIAPACAVVIAGGTYIYVRDNVGLKGDTKAAAEYDALSETAVQWEEVPEETQEEVPEEDDGIVAGDFRKGAKANGDIDIVEGAHLAYENIFEAPNIQVDFGELEKINEDVIGWIYAPQLNLNYPCVQAYYDGQYEHTTFSGEASGAGAIFMDSISRNDFKGYSDFLFGHNMRDGSMFGGLKKVEASGGKTLVANNPYVYIYTRNQVMQYRIFAYYRTLMGSKTYDDIESHEDYVKYVKYITGLSDMALPEDVSFEDDPEILTLSTCNGMPGGNKRLVVHTVKCGVMWR